MDMPDELIAGEKLRVERKTFYIDLKQNHQGSFLKITEDVNGRRDTIIVPSTGIHDFVRVITELSALLPPEMLEPEDAPMEGDLSEQQPKHSGINYGFQP
jgi:hypothetical protein